MSALDNTDNLKVRFVMRCMYCWRGGGQTWKSIDAVHELDAYAHVHTSEVPQWHAQHQHCCAPLFSLHPPRLLNLHPTCVHYELHLLCVSCTVPDGRILVALRLEAVVVWCNAMLYSVRTLGSGS